MDGFNIFVIVLVIALNTWFSNYLILSTTEETLKAVQSLDLKCIGEK